MIKIIKNYTSFNDKRGKMIGLLNVGNWQELNFFETEPNQIRGGHFHKFTDELFIILNGKIKVKSSKVDLNNQLVGRTINQIVTKGDVFIIPKLTHHTFEILEKSEWINALSLRMSDNDPDIHKIEKD